MNRDFSLKATPALARRLLRLATISRTNVDPAIMAMAEDDLLSADDFDGYDLKESERAAVQSIFDYGFRAVLPGAGGRNNVIALAAARMAKIDPVVIFSRRCRTWKPILEKFGFTIGADAFLLPLDDQKRALDKDFIKEHRHGLLLTDSYQYGYQEGAIQILVNDFPRAVVLTETMAMADLKNPARLLFGRGPLEVLTNHWQRRREMEVRGYTEMRPEELAFLCNIVTDTMTFTKQVESEEVREVRTSLFGGKTYNAIAAYDEEDAWDDPSF